MRYSGAWGGGTPARGLRLLTALLVALSALALGSPAGASAPRAASLDAQRQAAQLVAAADAVTAASAALDRLLAQAPSPIAIDRVRADLRLTQAGFRLRDAIRQEQALVYTLAGDPELESATLALVGGTRAAATGAAGRALRALWRMSGYPPGAQIHPRYSRRFGTAEPVAALLDYYRAAAARRGIDWTYLAAINFIESDFGRNNGPSSAGALGPMQFLPGTFREYGGGGDVNSARDSIQAAAAMLARNGAPSDYDRAVLRYNHSGEYVAAVKAYAAAMRSDAAWLTRLYYWSTYG
jgi:membrane-bound lytic murein transglycosylase B